MRMANVRTFIAVNLGSSLHEKLAEVLEKFASSKASVKWVTPENAHLTLKFLGNVEESRLPDVSAACKRAVQGSKPVDIEVRAVGCFPTMKRPRVVWLGIQKGADELKELQHKVEAELERVGFPREDREFKAHLTIGRVKGQQGLSRLCQLIEAERGIFIGPMCVEKISIMKSQLRPAGPIYTELEAIPLE
ncbi:MAG: RNA 2',3'-cyclic phosphodiesterase [Candidatus Abyssobacteria bacterium SURF_17]|uniref:RNA 2',3'-cyclic phosphodiesterase n=1 Tax=Candidatus Abyssobacteria bacterium SURF_17 TaxID=2093361 RepID=A0A419EY39_9BACT|nr:MAG: RNA 2',3'-cyclic phosphodiesterase [Candidatus Abyssubacteria bacterium SURF_17]